jgi:hypothetical protein
MDDLLSHPADWRSTHGNINTIIYADHNFNQETDETMRRWFSAMAAQGLRLELEVGAIKRWAPTSEKVFEIEEVVWDRINRLGGNIKSIAMDEPLVAAIDSFHQSEIFAVNETAKFVLLVRQKYPDIEIGDVESYPFSSLAEHMSWIDHLNKKLSDIGVRGLDFYRVDPDWNAFPSRGNWSDVTSLASFCGSRGLKSSLIFWSATAPAHRNDSQADFVWHDGLMTEANAIKEAHGRFDQMVVESWVGLPKVAIPEDDPYSFTGSLAAILKLLD